MTTLLQSSGKGLEYRRTWSVRYPRVCLPGHRAYMSALVMKFKS